MGPLSLDLRERVVTAIREENMSCRAAARQFKVSYASAIRWAQAMRVQGSFAPLTMGGDTLRRRSLALWSFGCAPSAQNSRATSPSPRPSITC